MPQTVAEPTDVEIRQGISATIRQALVDLYGVDEGGAVKVHDHWLWGFAVGENAGLLKILEGDNTGKVHGWLIGLAGVTRQRPSPNLNTPSGLYHLRKTNPNRRDILRNYRVWCYHQFDAGTAGDESNQNSENRLAIEIEAVADAFSKDALMGITNEWMMGNTELQFNNIDVFRFGPNQANVAQGILQVRLQKPLDLNQY